ncbi:MAG: gfo/Idh/MocA family oxidoreductase [Verrucomicrobiaceae bacterium]|nr:gfo/Idh/MocA family oxidoreductase [Verrucomicrobiaceae bacterium]
MVWRAKHRPSSVKEDSTNKDVPLAPPDKQPPNLKLPQVPKRKVGYAVVGLGELSLEQVLPAFGACHLSKPAALVSGHPDKARQVADAFQISQDAIYSYEDYDRLANDKRVDVLYIVLPNSMHAEFTIRGLRAGKHVLCEKPMATSTEEAEQMIRAARDANRKLMIAYRLHYEPLNLKAMELSRDGTLGRITTFASSNCQNVKAPNIRLSKGLGGGPLGDVGIYSINAARYILNEEPMQVTAIAHAPSDDGRFREVPESVAYTLHYPSGVVAHCDCSFGSAETRYYRVTGTKGSLELNPAFSYHGLKLRVKTGSPDKGDVKDSEMPIEQVNHFAAEMDHFSECLLEGGQPRTPGEMGLADLRIIAALTESIETGKPVSLKA